MAKKSLRIRYLEDYNYAALFDPEQSKTIRFRIDPDKEIEKLPWALAEMYDVSVNNLCAGGCNYCYINALPSGHNYDNIADKAKLFFDREDQIAPARLVNEMVGAYTEISKPFDFGLNAVMTTKPFQVAIGGAGEPTMHPDFVEFLKTLHSLDIVPNFTTNGMKVNDHILCAVDDYVGGVSVTLHKHLEGYWRKALNRYLDTDAKIHAHLIVYDKSSIKEIAKFFDEFDDVTLVLLPFQYVGFGAEYERKTLDFYDLLFDSIIFNGWKERIAYGAGFFEYLKTKNIVGASLYEPHHYSYYIDLDENGSVYPTSFEWENPILRGIF